VITYFEASAFVKLLVDEAGSESAGLLWNSSNAIVSSRLTYAEARAALAAAHRDGRLSAKSLQRAKQSLNARFDVLDAVEVTEGIVHLAGDLCEKHRLRGYDAVHLASALRVQAPDLVLTTWDADLAKAGRASGLDVAGIQLA
jgi:predicted nucleic acid-binding protein